MERTSDVIVIGSGPGGEGAAMQLAKGGKKVTVVEKYDRVGGGCTHWGTIPSKALRTAIFQATEALNHPLIASSGARTPPSVAAMGERARGIIDSQVEMRRKFYTRNHVDVIAGHARFVDSSTVTVDDATILTADHFIIAVGSRPYRPENVDFSHPRIFNSDTILGLTRHPQSMTVYGAGVIGCE